MSHTIYFVRHGQTDWNAEGRLQGQTDIPLNSVGREQAARNGKLLSDILGQADGVGFVASPLSRTRETMQIARSQMHLDPFAYETDSRLLEVNFGEWEQHTFSELEKLDPGCFERREKDKWNFVPPGDNAESYETVAARVGECLSELTRDTVCVAHGGILRSVFRLTDSLPPSECAALLIPQDKILRFENGRLEWL